LRVSLTHHYYLPQVKGGTLDRQVEPARDYLCHIGKSLKKYLNKDMEGRPVIRTIMGKLRPTLDGVLGPNSWEPIWTHLKQIFESLSWTIACIWVFQFMSFPFELFFWGSEPIDFPSKMVPCRFSLDLPLFGLGL
jgi:hypothetical protein